MIDTLLHAVELLAFVALPVLVWLMIPLDREIEPAPEAPKSRLIAGPDVADTSYRF